ncbi:MAG TPA: hypothetical protein VNI61_12020 [Gemmatimonadales bacterium]|nr:hypothetical protein [Gemmatimonadales bacterium]
MRPLAALAALGGALCGAAAVLGGAGAVAGGAAAVAAQLGAVALLRPAMRAPQREFLIRWLLGMAIRVAVLAAVVALAATNRDRLPLAETTLGFLGVLLPLLFLETRFLR